jgi:hypothetical protein
MVILLNNGLFGILMGPAGPALQQRELRIKLHTPSLLFHVSPATFSPTCHICTLKPSNNTAGPLLQLYDTREQSRLSRKILLATAF